MFDGGFAPPTESTDPDGPSCCTTCGSLAIGCEPLTATKMGSMNPVKHSVAVMIFRNDDVLSIRRPLDDDELPGIWGLPAGTARGSETAGDVILRIGQQKLGVQLTPIRKLASGTQNRPKYRLEMELWEASMEGEPTCPEWQWAAVDLLRPGMEAGSLCCELGIKSKSRVS